mmetsp:Transcript_1748/g.4080  ORF Transcript_1748/g.4080 Transcript_1748/m.4080 type:complete len:207 (+) Transcript_1748:100-720(+)
MLRLFFFTAALVLNKGVGAFVSHQNNSIKGSSSSTILFVPHHQHHSGKTIRLWLPNGDDNDTDVPPPHKTEQEKEAALQAAIDAMFNGTPLDESPEEIRQRIDTLLKENDIVLFMKGSKSFPQCGFSDTATKILEQLNVANDYKAVDVLQDENIRQGIKEYSQWPTIPQLFIRREFIGGSDIMLETFQSGELASLLKEGKAKDEAA